MITNTIICDKCKEMKAIDKCIICDSDICRNCVRNNVIAYGYNVAIFSSLILCDDCHNAIKKIISENKHDKKIFNELIIKYLKDNIVISEIENEKEKN
jgi:hypothetical protein